MIFGFWMIWEGSVACCFGFLRGVRIICSAWEFYCESDFDKYLFVGLYWRRVGVFFNARTLFWGRFWMLVLLVTKLLFIFRRASSFWKGLSDLNAQYCSVLGLGSLSRLLVLWFSILNLLSKRAEESLKKIYNNEMLFADGLGLSRANWWRVRWELFILWYILNSYEGTGRV